MPQSQGLTVVKSEPLTAVKSEPLPGAEPKFGTSTVTPDKPQPSNRGVLADLGIGASKGTGRTVLDLAQLAGEINPVDAIANAVLPESVSRHMPGNVLNRIDGDKVPALQTEGAAQNIGSYAPDALAVAIPALRGARAPQAVQRGASRMWQRAAGRPVLEPTTQANQILSEGFGRLTRDNAMGYAAAHPTSSTARQVMVKGVERAEANPQTLMGLMTGAFSPGTRAMTAQGIHSAAPAINAVTHGLGGGIADVLFRLLSGGQR